MLAAPTSAVIPCRDAGRSAYRPVLWDPRRAAPPTLAPRALPATPHRPVFFRPDRPTWAVPLEPRPVLDA